MRGLSYELLKEVAIFTLKNDLGLNIDQIEAFKACFETNIENIADEMIKAVEDEKRRRQLDNDEGNK